MDVALSGGHHVVEFYGRAAMGESYWQKDSLITHILFELCLFRYLAQSTFFRDTLYDFEVVTLDFFLLKNGGIFLILYPPFENSTTRIAI